MPSIGEATSSSLRRLSFINRVLSATNSLPPCCVIRKSYTTKTLDDSASGKATNENKDRTTYVRIGNSIKELKPVKAPEKVPRGYLSFYNGTTTDSQVYLKYLRWLMQKDQLRQDAFLIGQPGAFRRHLALSFAELTQREVEYLCLTRDTTESDIKQRREIQASSVVYANQCTVNAALNGRILIIEGIEKAERNLLPILNNLLENREINLDDGHFLVAPERYDKLAKLSGGVDSKDLADLNLLRVHEDFRVIAIGLPVPKYKGNSLDPPLRSRFQAHLVPIPDYTDFFNYVKSANRRVDEKLLKNLCDFGYSFYQPEIAALNLLDFPIENIDKLARIMQKCSAISSPSALYDQSFLNTGKLIHKLYPYELILKDEEANRKFYSDLLGKFNLPEPNFTKSATEKVNEIDYKLISVEINAKNESEKVVKFFSTNNKELAANLTRGMRRENSNGVTADKKQNEEFIMNDYHSSQLVDMMLNHACEHDFCLVGSQGCGKTELIKQFANKLDYNMHTLYVYKDMSSRELLQQRITLPNGDTKWQNSPLIEGAINGDLVILGKLFISIL
jgi:MoxR-like ATPase